MAAIEATRLLHEAALLAEDAYGEDGEEARELGWRPLTEAELGRDIPDFADGVQERDVGQDFSTMAHVSLGEAEGQRLVALAFGGTDEGSEELLYEIGRWDEYYEAHEELIEAVTDLVGEGLRDGSIDGLLVTGHSLGAVVTETVAARALEDGDPLVRENATFITFGSPGSPDEAPEDVELLNLLHSDDSVAQIGELAHDLPSWTDRLLPDDLADALDDLAREGTDLEVDRPEGRPLERGDALDLLELIDDSDDWEESRALVEHDLDLYIDTAAGLDDGAIA